MKQTVNTTLYKVENGMASFSACSGMKEGTSVEMTYDDGVEEVAVVEETVAETKSEDEVAAEGSVAAEVGAEIKEGE